MSVREWYAAGLDHHAEELRQIATLARLRAKRLDERYRGEPLTVFSEAMAAAAGELERAARQLRLQPKIGTEAAKRAFPDAPTP